MSDPGSFLDGLRTRSRAEDLALAAEEVAGLVTPVFDLDVAATLLNNGFGADTVEYMLGYIPDAIRQRLEAEADPARAAVPVPKDTSDDC